jgi:hypothetical protein
MVRERPAFLPLICSTSCIGCIVNLGGKRLLRHITLARSRRLQFMFDANTPVAIIVLCRRVLKRY